LTTTRVSPCDGSTGLGVSGAEPVGSRPNVLSISGRDVAASTFPAITRTMFPGT
jgi:hypothetical protein